MRYKKLIHRLENDFPDISFVEAKEFRWSSQKNTIFYNSSGPHVAALLLHEVAHSQLDHTAVTSDIELVRMECDAWIYAEQTLAPTYEVTISEDIREDSLDSYREWLHTRSLCKECLSNGVQTKTDTYKCIICGCQWRTTTRTKKSVVATT